MNNIKIFVNGRPANDDHTLYVNATGDYNYYLTVDIKGNPGSSNSGIVIKSYSKATRNVVIANNYQWFRKDKLTNNKIQNMSNFYQCSVKDVGSHIICHITPVEEGFYGECKLVYGLITLDNETEAKFNKAKRENMLKLPVQASANNGKLNFNMIDIKDGKVNCLDHNLQKLYELSINSNTNVVQAPNDGLKLKIYNNAETEINVKANNIIDKEVLMLFIDYCKTNEVVIPTRTVIAQNVVRNNSDQSVNSIASIKNFFEDKRQAENPLKINAFDPTQVKARNLDRSQSLQYNRIGISGRDVTVNADFEHSKTISEMDNILANYLVDDINKEKKKVQTNIYTNQQPVYGVVNYNNVANRDNVPKTLYNQPGIYNNPNIQQNPENAFARTYNPQIQINNSISRPASNYISSNGYMFQPDPQKPRNASPLPTNFNNIEKTADKFTSNNIPNQPVMLSQQNNSPNIGKVLNNPNPFFEPSLSQNNITNPPKKEESDKEQAEIFKKVLQQRISNKNFFDQFNKSKIGKPPQPKQGEEGSRTQMINIKPSSINDFNIAKQSESFMIEEGNSINLDNPHPTNNMNALEKALEKLRNEQELENRKKEANEQLITDEKNKLKQEIEKLKAANQSLLREVEFLRTEQKRQDEEDSIIRREKEVLLQEQLSKINKKYMATKKELTDLKTIIEQKDSTVQSTKESLFNLENSNFELKLENRKKDELIEELKESTQYLCKKLSVVEVDLKEKESLLIDKHDLVYRLETLKSDKSLLLDKLQYEDMEKRDLEIIINNLKASLIQHESLLQNMKMTLEDKNKKETSLRRELDDMAEKVLNFQREIEIKNLKIQEQARKAVYESKYEDITKKYTILEMEAERVKQINDMINIENKRLVDELEEKRNEIDQQLKYKDTYNTEKIRILEHEKNQIEQKNEKLKLALDELKDEKAMLSNRIELMIFEKNDLVTENERMMKRIEELMSNTRTVENRYMYELKELQNMENIYAQRQKQLEFENKSLKTRIDELYQSKEYIMRENSDLVSQIKALENRLATKQTELLKMSAVETNINTTEMLMTYKRKIAELQGDYMFLQEENSKLREDIYNLREEKLKLIEMNDQETNDVEVLRHKYIEAETKLEIRDKQIKDLESKFMTNNRKIDALNFELKTSAGKQYNHNYNETDEYRNLREELLRVKTELAALKEKNKNEHMQINPMNPYKIVSSHSSIEKIEPMYDIHNALHRLDTEDDKNTELSDIKYKLIRILSSYKADLAIWCMNLPISDIVDKIGDLIDELKNKATYADDLEKYIAEANKMIMVYEHERKEKDNQMEDLIEAKETLLNNFINK